MMRKLAAVIITFNEERNIGRCLRSLQGIADEIVVLDSFSTDRTPQICAEFEVKFVQREWEGYSASKNLANSMASYDWILSVDADEELSEELRKAILEVKNADHYAYSFNRLTNYCGQWIHHSGWYPDTKVRMFDKRLAQWQGTVHETLTVDSKEVKKLKGDLLHYSYYTISEHVGQTNRFASLSALELKEKGTRPSIFRAVVNAWVKFVRFYFIRFGFLDGVAGLNIALITAYGTYLKYMMHYYLCKQKS